MSWVCSCICVNHRPRMRKIRLPRRFGGVKYLGTTLRYLFYIYYKSSYWVILASLLLFRLINTVGGLPWRLKKRKRKKKQKKKRKKKLLTRKKIGECVVYVLWFHQIALILVLFFYSLLIIACAVCIMYAFVLCIVYCVCDRWLDTNYNNVTYLPIPPLTREEIEEEKKKEKEKKSSSKVSYQRWMDWWIDWWIDWSSETHPWILMNTLFTILSLLLLLLLFDFCCIDIDFVCC